MAIHFVPFDPRPDNFHGTPLDYRDWTFVEPRTDGAVLVGFQLMCLGMFGHPSIN